MANLIVNGNFASGAEAWNLQEAGDNSGSLSALSEAEGTFGRVNVTKFNEPNYPSYVILTQYITGLASTQGTHVLRFKHRGDAVLAGVYVWSADWLSFIGGEAVAVPSASSWVSNEMTVTLPEGGIVGVRFWATQLGSFDVKDVELVSPSVPSEEFGYSPIGSMQDDMPIGWISAQKHVAPKSGKITEIPLYCKTDNSSGKVIVMIYADAGNTPGELLAYSEEVTVGTEFGWVSFPVNLDVSEGVSYWFARFSDSILSTMYETGEANQWAAQSGVTYPTKPNPMAANYYSSYQASMYAQYSVLLSYSLTVNITPIGNVGITIDGQQYTAPLTITVQEGTHTITVPEAVSVGDDMYEFVGFDGTASHTITVNVLSDIVLTATYYKVPPTMPVYDLTITSSPISIPVIVLGQTLDTPFTIPLEQGEYTITVPGGTVIGGDTYNFVGFSDGVNTTTRTLSLTADTALEVYYEIVLPLKGILEIHAYIDNVEIVVPYEIIGVTSGTTPSSVEVDAGSYVIQVTYQDEPIVKNANVGAGQTVRVDFNFASPTPPPPSLSSETAAILAVVAAGVAIATDMFS